MGRNDPCNCDSGEKYKKCCLIKDEIYDFKVTYFEDESYDCQIRLSGKDNLHDLHHTIQETFRWDNDHMFSFFMSNKIWDKTSEFSGDPWGGGTADRVLKNLGLKSGQKFMYVFDYGDEHRFEIEVLSTGLEKVGTIKLGTVQTKGIPPDQYADHR